MFPKTHFSLRVPFVRIFQQKLSRDPRQRARGRRRVTSHDADDAPERGDDTTDPVSTRDTRRPVTSRIDLARAYARRFINRTKSKKKRHDVDRVDVSFCWPMRVRRASRDARAANVPTGCRRGVRQGKRRWTPWRTGVSDAATGGTVHAADRSG